MVDESLHISVQNKLVLYCRIAHVVCVCVCGGGGGKNGVWSKHWGQEKAGTVLEAIISSLDENHTDINRVSGLGTDGASVIVRVS